MTARTWQSRTTVWAAPERVLDTLTDTAACARWSPVAFEVDGEGRRLRSGTVRRVRGRVLGAPVRFHLHTLEANAHVLRLHARGPIDIGVCYSLATVAGGCEVDARVSIHPSGSRLGRIVERVTGLLLAGGTLDHTLERIAREAERAPLTPRTGGVRRLRADEPAA